MASNKFSLSWRSSFTGGSVYTGYVFSDATAVSPYLEEPQTGPTSLFCAALASRLRCYVIAGYPERLAYDEPRTAVLDQTPYKQVTEEVGANSAILYGPRGEFIGNYRKTNPYETDMTWAKPGQYWCAWGSCLSSGLTPCSQGRASLYFTYRTLCTPWRWGYVWI